MFAIISAIVFAVALFTAVATIGHMLTSYGDKMIAALRLEHVPAPVASGPVRYQTVRAARLLVTSRHAPALRILPPAIRAA